MRLQINETRYIETDHIESADVLSLSIHMVSGAAHSVNSVMFQTIIEAMRNKDAMASQGAY